VGEGGEVPGKDTQDDSCAAELEEAQESLASAKENATDGHVDYDGW